MKQKEIEGKSIFEFRQMELNMKDFLEDLLNYSHHFNQKMADKLIENQSEISEKSILLFNHILNAHEIWCGRIVGNPSSTGVWDLRPSEGWKAVDLENHQKALRIIRDIDLNKEVTYRNSSGKEFTNATKDILFHIINHSTHHRGQIVSEINRIAKEPLLMDYIFYKRMVS
ncbi:DinB family protein [Peijinzhouia sedimentorum]